MKKLIDAVFVSYLNQQFAEFIPKYSATLTEEKYEEVWESLGKNLPKEKFTEYSDLKNKSEYEIVKREFYNAFRLGFMLCAEVFFSE